MTDTKAVQRLFDELAGEYDQHVPFFASFGRDLAHWCVLEAGQRVLDIAAGRGAIAGPAARVVGEHGEVVAIDTAPGMLRGLAVDHPNLPQLVTCGMDAHDLGFPDAAFDVVTCGFTLHFLADPQRALSEAHRVLRPGGLLAMSGPPTDRADSGEPDEDTDERWDFYGELMHEMSQRSRPSGRPGLFTPPPRPLPQLCREVGFVDLEQRSARASFVMRDSQHYWDWMMSHGFRGFVRSLDPELADEFQTRMLAGLDRLHTDGGITMDAEVTFDRMRKRERA